MSGGPLERRRVAIVVDDDPDARHLEAALSLSAHLADTCSALPEIWSSDGCDARARCRAEKITWRAIPSPRMDGLCLSWIFIRRLVARLADRAPEDVVAVGPHAGVGVALVYPTSRVRSFLWYQVDGNVRGLDPRAAGLAVRWTRRYVAVTPAARRALVALFGTDRDQERRETLPYTLVGGSKGSTSRALVVRALVAAAGETRDARSMPTFDRDLVYRSVFPSFVELHDEAERLVCQVRAAGVGRVAIVGDGLRARVLAAACRERSITVAALVSPGRHRSGQPLDGVPRRSLTEALDGGSRRFVLTDEGDVSRTARRIRQAAACRWVASEVEIFQPAAAPRRAERVPTAGVLGADAERRARRLIVALRDSRVRTVQIYGASDVGRALLRHARRHRIDVSAFIDGNRALWDDVVDGVEVRPLSRAVGGEVHTYAIGSFANATAIRHALNAAYQTLPVVPRVFAP